MKMAGPGGLPRNLFIKYRINNDWGRYQDWDYQFYADDFDHDELYDWCLHNIGHHNGWVIEMSGVIIREEQDAVLFALRWC